jgi:DNA polymerase I-like protein with 3'-5' exonuclease and polymerase domains
VVRVQGKEAVYPQYKTLVKTGRTSSFNDKERDSGLNIQQIPREPWFRSMFVPRPGYKLVTVDYSFIELRTLASVCLARYGWSKLAETIQANIDPHVYTAALVQGMDVEKFKALKKTDPDTYKANRQAAKAVNFGVPGGLGAVKLAAYAKANYGVTLSPEEAKALKDKLVKEVYPELELYLSDHSVEEMAINLSATVPQVREVLGLFGGDEQMKAQAIRKIVAGRAVKASGVPYHAGYVLDVWRSLEKVSQDADPWVRDQIATRNGSEKLERRLFRRTVPTLTGRLRAGVSYTEARNTPFQGLAADGAKLALWEQWKADLRVVAFVHDEIVLEVPADQAEDQKALTERLMNEAMEQVLFPGIPSATEGVIGDSWIKG